VNDGENPRVNDPENPHKNGHGARKTANRTHKLRIEGLGATDTRWHFRIVGKIRRTCARILYNSHKM
jgi:hypothetical protein